MDKEKDGRWGERKKGERPRARLRVRSSIQKRGTQERPWIYVDVSLEVSEKEKGPRKGRRMKRDAERQSRGRREKYL